MLTRNFKALERPIIGRVLELNGFVLKNRHLPEKIIQREYVDEMVKDGKLLFLFAMRQLKGKDYKKRALELIEEIQALNYLVYSLRGWNKSVTTNIDVMCDDIAQQICKIDNSVAAGITKSSDERE